MLQVLLFDRLCWWWSGYFLISISIFHVLGVTLSIIWRRMSRHEKCSECCWSKSLVVSIVGISPVKQVVIPLLLSQIIIIIIRIIIIIWGRTFGHTSVGVTHVTCWIKHTQKETTFASSHNIYPLNIHQTCNVSADVWWMIGYRAQLTILDWRKGPKS